MESYFNKKKITIFTAETIPSFAGGGRHAFQLSSYLNTLGANCQIICYNYNNEQRSKENIAGITIRRKLYFNSNFLTKVLSLPYLVFQYLNETIRCHVVLLYGSYLIGYPFIILFAKLFKKKVIFRSTLIGSDDIDSLKQKSKWRWFFLKKILEKIDCYWAINQRLADIWTENMSNCVTVLNMPQGVNEKHFSPKFVNENKKKEYLPNSGEPIRLISCGFLVERKGYRELFDVLSKVNINFKYIVVGQYQPDISHRSSPDEKREMQELLILGEQLLGNKIEFLNTTDDIKDLFSNRHILLHGAKDERPNVVMEAMAMGLPTICRRLDFLKKDYLIHNKNSILYSTKEELELVLNSLNENKERLTNISLEGRKNIEESYSFEKTISELSECLKQKRKQ